MDSTKCDIVFGTESWLSSEIKDNEAFPPGYTVYYWYRSKRRGSIHMCLRQDHQLKGSGRWNRLWNVWAKLDIVSCKSLYIAAYYHPNTHDAESLAQLTEFLNKVPRKSYLGGRRYESPWYRLADSRPKTQLSNNLVTYPAQPVSWANKQQWNDPNHRTNQIRKHIISHYCKQPNLCQ